MATNRQNKAKLRSKTLMTDKSQTRAKNKLKTVLAFTVIWIPIVFVGIAIHTAEALADILNVLCTWYKNAYKQLKK